MVNGAVNGAIGRLQKIVLFFWPPRSSDAVAVAYWHRKITVGFYLVAAMWFLLLIWLLGMFPPWVPHLAYAGDLSVLRDDNAALREEILIIRGQVTRSEELILRNHRELRLGQLLPELYSARLRHCLVQRQATQEMVNLYLGKLRDLEAEYFQVTGEAYVRESCAAVLVPGS